MAEQGLGTAVEELLHLGTGAVGAGLPAAADEPGEQQTERDDDPCSRHPPATSHFPIVRRGGRGGQTLVTVAPGIMPTGS
ncbi:hypothetical protein [Streptomyces tendae]